MQNYLALTLTLTAGTYATLEPCPSDLPLSCQNTTAVPSSDSCCFNAPGGALLLTQFWDTDPVTGPVDSWTIHGLWYLSSPPQKEDSFVNKMNRPDNCDGSYQQYCDSSREYTDISGILKDQGRDELLSYMNEYWLSDSGDDEEMWEHEFGKHGTCINTMKPSCYDDYSPREEVGDYFQKAVDLFKNLDTYKALANTNIKPHPSKTYKLSAIKKALADLHDGHEPAISCSDGALSQVWYFFNVRGNAIDGEYEAIDPLSDSECDETVKYLPKRS